MADIIIATHTLISGLGYKKQKPPLPQTAATPGSWQGDGWWNTMYER